MTVSWCCREKDGKKCFPMKRPSASDHILAQRGKLIHTHAQYASIRWVLLLINALISDIQTKLFIDTTHMPGTCAILFVQLVLQIKTIYSFTHLPRPDFHYTLYIIHYISYIIHHIQPKSHAFSYDLKCCRVAGVTKSLFRKKQNAKGPLVHPLFGR